MSGKLAWEGTLVAVQPRIRLLRSFDEVHHAYLGYALQVEGCVGGERGCFSIGVGKAAQVRFAFRVGCRVQGLCERIADPRKETVDYYKVSALVLLGHGKPADETAPPWLGLPPSLDIYRQRGHRRLDPRTYAKKCSQCIWGCRMPVEMIVDHWNPSQKRYRDETFCYGPKSCSLYRAGANRKVPGRNGMVWVEEDWVDEEMTSHRDPDD